jgi:AraC-like DNA-binding protein
MPARSSVVPGVAMVRREAAVPALYPRLLFEYLQARGHDAGTLLGEAPTEASEGEARCPMPRWRHLLARAAAALDDPLLGLRLGATLTPSHLGLLGYLLLSCDTLGSALQRFERYQRLFYDASRLDTRMERDCLVLTWGTELGAPGALVDECAIASLVQIARDLTAQRVACRDVQFVNPRPPRLAPYTAFFGCEPRFDADCTRLGLPLAALALPLRQPDAALLRVMEEQADQRLRRLCDVDPFEQDLRAQIARRLRSGEPAAEPIAAAMGLSTRSLHRRLAERGWNFRRLLGDTRRALADDYLADPRLELSEIALLLGYSEQSAFTRAYRGWSGRTPLQARRSSA